jgi:hypothetical protein
LFNIHHVQTPVEYKNILKMAKMTSDDLSKSTLIEYNRDLQFYLQCAGRVRLLPEKENTATYVNGLKPSILAENVRTAKPETLQDAQNMADQLLPTLRTAMGFAKAAPKTETPVKTQKSAAPPKQSVSEVSSKPSTSAATASGKKDF